MGWFLEKKKKKKGGERTDKARKRSYKLIVRLFYFKNKNPHTHPQVF